MHLLAFNKNFANSHLKVIDQPVNEISLNNYEILMQNIPKNVGSIMKAVQLLCLTGIST